MMGLFAAGSWLVACGPQVTTPGASGGTDSGTGDGSGDASGPTASGGVDESGTTGPTPPGPGPDPDPDPIGVVPGGDLDILLVVDNSGSMGEEQAVFAYSLGQLVEVLERRNVQASYRIAVTTTDNGNPWCNGTSPEAGKFVATSCRSRTEDFVFAGSEVIDVTQEACLDVCPEAGANIPLAQPWVERINGVSNLPAGLGAADALACIAPQGITGCGFEEPLESMYKALARATTEGESEFGFLRPEATLAVVFVTDEVDASINKQFESIYLPDGNRVFWSDPTSNTPSSAVGWNAGVECTGSSPYAECHAVDLDVDGDPVGPAQAADLAVLRPVARYIDLLQKIEDAQHELRPDAEVLVSVIAGANGDGSVTYADAADPGEQLTYGIGPGCQSADGRATPPVRLRELAEAFAVGGLQNVFTICNGDFGAALEGIAESAAGQVAPLCVPGCLADVDLSTPQLDLECEVTEQQPQIDGSVVTVSVPPCTPAGELPAGVDACFIALTDPAKVHDYCLDIGNQAELLIVRREGVPAPGGTAIYAECVETTDCGGPGE
jgi:hypothetical protein